VKITELIPTDKNNQTRGKLSYNVSTVQDAPYTAWRLQKKSLPLENFFGL
jgi:hypothetical protein